MSTWASPRDAAPKDDAFGVVPVMLSEWHENSVRSVKRPHSLMSELDLRFKPDQERKYKQGLQENLVVGGLACIGSATGATLFAVVPAFVREVAREENPFGTTFDARAWVFLVWALNLLLMLSYLLLSTIRLCRGRLQSWNWEAFFVVVVSIFLFSMAFANFWHLPYIVGEDPVGLWVHDARGSDIFMLLAIDGILTMVAMYVPVRSSVLWIPFVCESAGFDPFEIGMPSEIGQYQFQRLRSVVLLSAVLAKIATAERSWGDLHIDGDRSWQTTTLPDESEGEEEQPQGSIAYSALHARTEAFLKASRNYQVAVKGPLMDATDVYLQQKERYEHFAHNLDKGERQQHKLIHMMRSSLRKHHGRKMEEFQKTLEAERAEKKATGEDENEDEDEDDEDSDEADDSTEESGDSGSTESESEEGKEERNDERAETPPADSDSKDESDKKSKESAAPNANSEEHHENPEKESKAKDESEKKSKESAAPTATSEEHHEPAENANSEEHHEPAENANSEAEHHENPEKESKAKDESEKESKESAASTATSEAVLSTSRLPEKKQNHLARDAMRGKRRSKVPRSGADVTPMPNSLRPDRPVKIKGVAGKMLAFGQLRHVPASPESEENLGSSSADALSIRLEVATSESWQVAVVPFFVNTIVFQSVFTDTHMILFALLGLSGFAYHGALRREKTHRQKWTFEHMVEEAEEVMREQDNTIQETTAQVKGLRVVAEALCDVIVKLDSKKCVYGANTRQDAFFETKLEGRCFEDFLSEQDRSRFSKLMSSIQVGFPACMPVTIQKEHLTAEVHLLAVDTGLTREPRYLIGMRIEAEHFTAVEEEVGKVQSVESARGSSSLGMARLSKPVKVDFEDDDISCKTYPRLAATNVPLATPARSRALCIKKLLPRWQVPRNMNSCCQYHTAVDSVVEALELLATTSCEPLFQTFGGGQCRRCLCMCNREQRRCAVCGYALEENHSPLAADLS
eukprot:s2722_g15.t4